MNRRQFLSSVAALPLVQLLPSVSTGVTGHVGIVGPTRIWITSAAPHAMEAGGYEALKWALIGEVKSIPDFGEELEEIMLDQLLGN